MRQDLTWCAGKFVYARGGSALLHFMPLHSYNLEYALDISLILALRGARISHSRANLGDRELSRWMDILAVEQIANIVRAIMPILAIDGHPARIIEYHAGLGVVFDVLQWVMSCEGAFLNFEYVAVGPESDRRKFQTLHQGEQNLRYLSFEEARTDEEADLIVINQLRAVRQGIAKVDFELPLRRARGPAILALHVNEGSSECQRITISGARVTLTPFDDVGAFCRRNSPHWRYRYVEGHDSGYFLPQSSPKLGMMLAYNAGVALEIPGFRAM